ncbi:DinB superfamily protein [Tenacibaculum sp. MAR_2010_89]|uniref:dihydrofolate reductase n=1 Tax=Tenacibaculum sp. MAR_2010_89 TaxID=1250198 RepID=UPI000895CC2E|nr:DinB superfamily protein [Tenacibaculum sp. MAR_2010_89]
MGKEYVIKTCIENLENILNSFPLQVASISKESWNKKESESKWSKKEVLGHLIDSGFNNLQRFIRVQYEETPHIAYNQNEWVKSQNWQALPIENVVQLWKVINQQILHIWKNFPENKVNAKINVSKEKTELYTFAEIMEDYIVHFHHHEKQIVSKMIIVIAAIGKNNELGKGNDLIWHLPADLKRFKKVTSGHHIVMGRNTFESIGKPLPNRTTIIITRNKDYSKEGCLTANSIEEALELSKKDTDVFIIGGAQIYKQALESNLVDKLDITLVHENFEADVYFPEINTLVWKEASREDFIADEKNKYDYSFVSYVKK